MPRTDQIDPSAIGVSNYTRVGNNRIEVHVATLLGNAATGKTRSYGLVGQVRLTPYGLSAISVTKPSVNTITTVSLQ